MRLKSLLKLSVLAGAVMLITGCSQTVTLTGLKPAPTPKALEYGTVAVLPLKNDAVNMTAHLETLLQNKTVNGKNVFKVVSRDNLKGLLDEQALQNSNLVSKRKDKTVEELIGADAIITGVVDDTIVRDTHYYKIKQECRGDNCKYLVDVRVSCVKRAISTNASFKMTDVRTGEVVTSKNFFDSETRRVCQDDSYGFLQTESIIYKLQKNIAKRFVNSITPNTYKMRAVIAEDEPVIDLTSKQEDMVEQGVSAIKHRILSKADTIFKTILDQQPKSYVANYNLGIIAEMRGNYSDAREFYLRCTHLVEDFDDVPELSDSLNRIKNVMQEQKATMKQMKALQSK